MSIQTVPTKGNLLAAKKSLALSKNGFELLDRKRNILIREMMSLMGRASNIQNKIDDTYAQAYQVPADGQYHTGESVVSCQKQCRLTIASPLLIAALWALEILDDFHWRIFGYTDPLRP